MEYIIPRKLISWNINFGSVHLDFKCTFLKNNWKKSQTFSYESDIPGTYKVYYKAKFYEAKPITNKKGHQKWKLLEQSKKHWYTCFSTHMTTTSTFWPNINWIKMN